MRHWLSLACAIVFLSLLASASVTEKAQDAGESVAENLKTGTQSLAHSVSETVKHAVDAVTGGDSLKTKAEDAASSVRDASVGASRTIRDKMEDAGEYLKDKVQDALGISSHMPLKDKIEDAADKASFMAHKAGQKAEDLTHDARRHVEDTGISLTQRIKDGLGLSSASQDAKDAVKDAASNAASAASSIGEKLKSAVGAAQDKVEEYTEPSLSDKIAHALHLKEDTVADKVHRGLEHAQDQLNEKSGGLIDKVKDSLGFAHEKAEEYKDKLKDYTEPTIGQKIKHSLGLGNELSDRAKQGLEHAQADLNDKSGGMIDKVKDSLGFAHDKVEEYKDKVKDYTEPTLGQKIKHSLGLGSELEDRAKQGLEHVKDDVNDKTGGLVDKVKDSLGFAHDKAAELHDKVKDYTEPTLGQKIKHSLGLGSELEDRAKQGLEHVKDDVNDKTGGFVDKVKDSLGFAHDKAAELHDKVKDYTEPTMGQKIKQSLGLSNELTDRAKQGLEHAKEDANEKTGGLLDKMKDSLGFAQDKAEELKDRAQAYTEPSIGQKIKHSLGYGNELEDRAKQGLEHAKEDLNEKTGGLLDKMKDSLGFAHDKAQEYKEKVADYTEPTIGEKIKHSLGLGSELEDRARHGLENAKDHLNAKTGGLVDKAKDSLESAKDKAEEYKDKVMDYTEPTLGQKIKHSLGLGSELEDRARQGLEHAKDDVNDKTGGLVDKVKSSLGFAQDKAEEYKDKVKDYTEPTLGQKIKHSLGLGSELEDRARQGLEHAKDDVNDKTGGFVDKVKSSLGFAQDKAEEYKDKVKDYTEPTLGQKIKHSLGLGSELEDRARQGLEHAKDDVNDKTGGFVDKVKSSLGFAQDKAEEYADKVKDYTEPTLGQKIKHSLGLGSELEDRAKQGLEHAKEAANEHAGGLFDRVRDSLGIAHDKSDDLKEKSKEYATYAKDKVHEMAEPTLAEKVKHAFGYGDDVSDKVKDSAQEIQDKAKEYGVGDKIKGALGIHDAPFEPSWLDRIKHTFGLHQYPNELRDKAEEMKRQAEELLQQANAASPKNIIDKVGDAISGAKGKAAKMSDRVKESAGDVTDKVKNAKNAVRDKVNEYTGSNSYDSTLQRFFDSRSSVFSDMLSLNKALIFTFSVVALTLVGILIGARANWKIDRNLLRSHNLPITIGSALLIGIGLSLLLISSSKANLDNILETPWKHSSREMRRQVQDKFECCGYRSLVDNVALPCLHADNCRDAIWNTITHWFRPLGVLFVALGALTMLGVPKLAKKHLASRPPAKELHTEVQETTTEHIEPAEPRQRRKSQHREVTTTQTHEVDTMSQQPEERRQRRKSQHREVTTVSAH